MSRAGRFLPIITFVFLAGCAGSPEEDGKTPIDAPPMRLVAYDSCAELLNGLRTATEKQVTAFGMYGDDMNTRRGPASLDAGQGQEGNKSSQAAPHSGTNVHEIGADEPDLVKTDGSRIVVLTTRNLVVLDPASRTVRHRMPLPDDLHGSRSMFLSGDRALIFGTGTVTATDLHDGPVGLPGTRLVLVDLSGAPRVIDDMTTQAGFLDARMTGSVARVVVQSHPRIDFPQPDPASDHPRGEVLERNKEAVRSAPLSAWLPTFTVGGQTHTVPCERVSRPADSPGGSLVTVLTVDLARGLGDPGAVSVATEGSTVYGNGASLYVVGAQHFLPRQGTPRTQLHKFDVRGTGLPRYLASGSVSGHLLNQYSLSEHAGHLRVATTNLTSNRSESSVHVLRQNGPRLDTVGRVDGLGKGERIYSVRFLGTTGYVVTFRQVDPLYAVDLNDPAKPKVTGELKIAGYSAYLHPLPGNRLLGVGQDADARGRTQGTQVSLFDVSGPPRRLSVFRLPGATSQAEFDPHAFLHWPQSGLTVIPVSRGYTGASEALVLSVTSGELTERGTVEHPMAGAIQRSVIVGDTLWTISETGARATDPQTMTSQTWLPY